MDATRDGLSAPPNSSEEGGAPETAEPIGLAGASPLVVYCSNYAVAF